MLRLGDVNVVNMSINAKAALEARIEGIRASAEKAEPEEEILPDTRPKVGKDTAKPATAAPAPNKKPTDAKPAANDRPAKP